MFREKKKRALARTNDGLQSLLRAGSADGRMQQLCGPCSQHLGRRKRAAPFDSAQQAAVGDAQGTSTGSRRHFVTTG